MSDPRRRRRFLKQSAALVTGMAATNCSPTGELPANTSPSELDHAVLEAVARIVLPRKTLGDARVSNVLEEFLTWLEEFQPVAELDHPYLWTDEIAYGPPDPGPRWASQLEALDLESNQRYGVRFVELGDDEQHAVLTRQLPKDLGSELPHAGEAPHVAIGLVAHFYGTSTANDLGYGAAIDKQTCRGLDTGPDEPALFPALLDEQPS